MNPFLSDLKRKPGRFRIGDRVRITRGFTGAEAQIMEDHGPLGPDNQRFYTIHVKDFGGQSFIIDYPEDEMELLADQSTGKKGG